MELRVARWLGSVSDSPENDTMRPSFGVTEGETGAADKDLSAEMRWSSARPTAYIWLKAIVRSCFFPVQPLSIECTDFA